MSESRMIPTSDERKRAGEALENIFFNGRNTDYTAQYLHEYLEKRSPGVEKILAADLDEDSSELPDQDLPQTIINMFGTEVFEGRMGGELRDMILDRMFDNADYDKIFSIFQSVTIESKQNDLKAEFFTDKKTASDSYRNKLKKHGAYPWRPGRDYARRFVRMIGMDSIFGGLPSDPSPDRMEAVSSRSEIKPLIHFQENMKAQLIEILNKGDKRAIVTLPTGAGKTRVIVEAVVDFLNRKGMDRNILWIADTQEVCEQAVVCFKQIWEWYGEGDTLKVYRAWGGNDTPAYDEKGIIVGSIQKLNSPRTQLDSIQDNLSAVIIDEAHHSVAESYIGVLERLGLSDTGGVTENDDKIPLIGLTATPQRITDHGTARLRKLYGNNMIYPNDGYTPQYGEGEYFADEWESLGYMRKKLTEWKYLADASFIPIGIDRVKLSQEESEYFAKGDDRWMGGIATMAERNKRIKSRILEEVRKGKKILYFGPNVSQSNSMARMLENDGVGSVCITSDTRSSVRKSYIDTFNVKGSNAIQVMCNYNVLSTGFDSPEIDVVIIARPTTSIVAYQQMVGRGLRGEKFGGRLGNHCDIFTVKDNISKFNDEVVKLGYQEYEEYMEDEHAQ